MAITEGNENPKFAYIPLFQDELVATVAPSYPWASRRWVDTVEFASQNYIMYNIPDEENSNFKMLFKHRRPPKVYKITLTEAILEMVKAGLGVAVLPNWVVAVSTIGPTGSGPNHRKTGITDMVCGYAEDKTIAALHNGVY